MSTNEPAPPLHCHPCCSPYAQVICFPPSSSSCRRNRRANTGCGGVEGAQNIATLFRLFSLALTFPHYNLFFPRHGTAFSASSSLPLFCCTTHNDLQTSSIIMASMSRRWGRAWRWIKPNQDSEENRKLLQLIAMAKQANVVLAAAPTMYAISSTGWMPLLSSIGGPDDSESSCPLTPHKNCINCTC